MSLRRSFSKAGARPIVAGAALAALLSLTACASVAIEDAVPSGALPATSSTAGPLPPPAAPPGVAPTAVVAGTGSPLAAPGTVEGVRAAAAVDTGTFPNLNTPRHGETVQLTEEETQATMEALRQAKGSQAQIASGKTATSADEAALRKLGETHAEEVLKQIESE